MKKTCCCCLSTILFIIILIVGVFFGGTWYAYDKYGKAYCGISYGEVLGLVPGLYKASEKKIVTKPFDKVADLTSFESKMKKAMFIDDNSPFSIADILAELLAPKPSAEPSAEPSGEAPLVNQADNSLLNLLKDLNFDFSSLEGFEIPKEGNSPLGIVSATDKEIAALFSSAFATLLDSKVGDIGGLGVGASELIQVKQVIISGADEGATEQDVRLTATLKLDISAALKAVMAKASLPSIASSMATGILPKSLFISMVVAPYATDVQPIISVNEYSDKNNGLLMDLVKNVINKIGNDENKFDNLFNSVDGYVKKVFTKVKTMVDMKFVGESAELDAVYTMMSMMKLNINKNDFLEMISFLQCRDLTALEALTYEKAAIDDFMVTLKQNYAISDKLGIDKTNLTDKLGQVPNNLDLTDYDLNIKNENRSVLMTYDAMISIIEQEINKPATPSSKSATAFIMQSIKIKQLIAAEATETNPAEAERIKIVVEVDLAKLLKIAIGTDEVMLHLAGELLPAKLFLTFEMNLSGEMQPVQENGQVKLDENGNVIMELKYKANTTLLVNDLDEEQSIKLLGTIKAMTSTVGGESLSKQFDIDALKLNLSKTITDAVKKLEEQAKGKIDIKFTRAGVILPTVYELIGSMFNLSSTIYDKTEMPDQVRLIIKGLQDTDKTAFETNLKFQSNFADNGAPLSANYKDLFEGADVSNLERSGETIEGITHYYVDATADLNIYDKNINHILSVPFVAGGADIAIKQTVFINTTTASQSHVTREQYYADLIAGLGFTGNVIIQTADINIERLVTVKNPLIPKSVYMTYAFNVGEDGGRTNVQVLVNSLSKEDTNIIEQIIGGAQNKPFSFESIINDAVAQSLNKEIKIALPTISFKVPLINVDATINPLIISIKLTDLFKGAELNYMDADTEEFKLGTAKLKLTKSEKLEVLFADGLSVSDIKEINKFFNVPPIV